VPTVLRFDGLRAAIYPNDHRPAHAHVIGPGSEAVFHLNCPGGPVSLRESYGFSGRGAPRGRGGVERCAGAALPELGGNPWR